MPLTPYSFTDLFGTNPHILHRAEGPSTSREAAYSVDTARLERMVLIVIGSFDDGCISDEVRAHFPEGTPYSSVTARYAALDTKGLIRRYDWRTRPGDSGKSQMIMTISPLGRQSLFLSEVRDAGENGQGGNQETPD
jgi:hypothetical protein